MPQDKTYLDEQGNPVNPKKVYLDEQGNPAVAPPTALSALTQPTLPQEEETAEDKTSWLTKASRLLGSMGAQGIGAWMGGVAGRAFGPPGIALGAGLGAAAGEATHQIGQQIFDPEGAPQTSAEAVQRITTAIPFGAAQEIGAIRRGAGILPKGLSEVQKVAQTAKEYAIPLTGAQRSQGSLRVMLDEIIKRSLGAGKIFRRQLETPQNLAIQDGVAKLAREISATGSRETLGTVIQDSIEGAYKQAGTLYDDALETISKAGASNAPLNVSRLQPKALKLVNELELSQGFGAKALETVESRKLALGILREFANPVEGAVLTFEQARRRRTQLKAIIDSGEMTIGKGSLSQLRQFLADEMKTALGDTGRKDLSELFTIASQNYAIKKELMDTNIIKGLIKAQQPETIGKFLLARGKQTAIKDLRELIGVKSMEDVQAGLWEELFASAQKGGFTDAELFANKWSALGDSVKRELWSPVMVAKLNKFVTAVKNTGLKPEEVGQTLLSFGQFQRMSAAGGQILGAGAALAGVGSTGQGDFGDWAIRFGEAGLMSLSPMMLAKLITRPGAIDMMNRAITTSARTRAGKELCYKLMTLIVAEQMKESHPQKQQQ
jgi:hypothetical protein